MQILTDEYHLSSLNRRKIINGFNRYYITRISNRDAVIKNVSNSIIHQIEKLSSFHENAKELEKDVKNTLANEIIEYFPTPEGFTGAFLYEILEGVDI